MNGDTDTPRMIGGVLGAAIIISLLAALLYGAWANWRVDRNRGESERRKSRRISGLCPNCSYDVRAGHERCPECGEVLRGPVPAEESPEDDDFEHPTDYDTDRLLNDWPAAPIAPHVPDPDEKRAVLFLTLNPWLADTIVDQLNARGIWCLNQTKHDELLNGIRSPTINYQRVVVNAGERKRATAVLEPFRKGRQTLATESDELD